MNPEPTDKLQSKAPLGEIAREFLRLGFIAFGGPALLKTLVTEDPLNS
jgi:chromate transport protein ChrA